MGAAMKGSKRFGIQGCDSCGRDFNVTEASCWECPNCGFDNRQRKER